MRSLRASSERAFSSEPADRAASICRPAETKLDAILETASGTRPTSFHLCSFELQCFDRRHSSRDHRTPDAIVNQL